MNSQKLQDAKSTSKFHLQPYENTDQVEKHI